MGSWSQIISNKTYYINRDGPLFNIHEIINREFRNFANEANYELKGNM